MAHWLSHFFGLDNGSGPFYGFWSGVGSDIGELALVGAVAGVFRHHNCHIKGCWRLGKHPHGPYKLCAKHHPRVPPLVTEGIVKAHQP